MPRKVLKTVDLDNPALARQKEFRQAVCQIARLAAEPEVENLARAWRAGQGELLTTSATEVRFFADQAVIRLTDDRGLVIELRNGRGEVKSVDPEKMPLTLAPLKRQLQSAAIDRIVQLQYAAIAEKAGLPLAQVHQSVRLTRDETSRELAAQIAGNLDELLTQALVAIRRLLLPEAIDLARTVMPGASNLAWFNRVYINRDVFRRLTKEAPQLLPLLSRAIQEKEMTAVGYDAYKQLKEKFRAAGHSEATWKFLVRMPPATIRQLAETYPLHEFIGIVGLLAETGAVPPDPLLQAWCQAVHYKRAYFLPPAWFRRAATAYAQSLPGEREVRMFIATDYSVASRWLIAQMVMPDAHQVRAGWSWITRQATEWQAEMQAQRRRKKTWRSLVGEYTDGDYTIVPLDSATTLRDEGKRMRHCIGSYDDACMNGDYRAFSIRLTETGKSKATLAIYTSGGEWLLSAVRGPCNAMPPAELQTIARRVAEKYNAAWQRFMTADPLGQKDEGSQ